MSEITKESYDPFGGGNDFLTCTFSKIYRCRDFPVNDAVNLDTPDVVRQPTIRSVTAIPFDEIVLTGD